MRPTALGLLALLPLAAGCAALATTPSPSAVSLTESQLDVRMSNGTTCIGTPSQAGALTWSGALANCPQGFAYTVEIDPRSNILREAVRIVLEAVELDDLISPVAQVSVTDPDGRVYGFALPRPVN